MQQRRLLPECQEGSRAETETQSHDRDGAHAEVAPEVRGANALGPIEEARRIGPWTGELVGATLAAKRHPEMGYRSCLGILRLARTYPAKRMEAAAQRALRARAYSSRSMESILRNQLDRLPIPGDPAVPSVVEHDNICGAGYFGAIQ